MREKRSKGLCFKCDEKWSLTHVRKHQEMRVILAEQSDEDDGGEERENQGEITETEQNDPLAGITLQSSIGFTKPKTMKLEGTIKGQTLFVLIDSGASSNFISTPTAQLLGLSISACTSFGVTLGTGVKVFGDGICKGSELRLQGIVIEDDFFALE